ncbi:MAG TPA: hypothetical protein VK717_04855 [Opitutaceae bacterium]|nr:hypothetical protein [Opitutaceae bacterium]
MHRLLQLVWAPKRNGAVAVLAISAAVAAVCPAADQPAQAPAADTSALIRAQFPYGTNTSLPVVKNSARTAAPLHVQTERQEAMVQLPEFKVNAQRYSDLEIRLNQIDRSIRAEQLQSVPSKLDTALNNDRASKFSLGFSAFSFGHETSEKRANDATRRMQALEMRRIIEIRLPSATPEEKKQLEEDRQLLEELSVHKDTEDSFRDLHVRQRDQRNPSP